MLTLQNSSLGSLAALEDKGAQCDVKTTTHEELNHSNNHEVYNRVVNDLLQRPKRPPFVYKAITPSDAERNKNKTFSFNMPWITLCPPGFPDLPKVLFNPLDKSVDHLEVMDTHKLRGKFLNII